MSEKANKKIAQREFRSMVNVPPEETRRLWRDKGRPVVANLFGTLRYLYDDGSIDQKSTVDHRVENVRARVTEKLVAITDKGLPDFAEDWRRGRIAEALEYPNGEVVYKSLGARIMIFDTRRAETSVMKQPQEELPDATKSNIIPLSLPETATGNVTDVRLDNVA